MAPKAQNGVQLQFPPGQAVAFDPDAFDDAIRSQGVQLIHFRAMRCPVGMIDKSDSRRPHDDHSGCSNGHIYTRAGVVTANFTSNSNEVKQMDMGLLDGSTVMITTPRMYDDVEERVSVINFDRFYLLEEDITVEHYELVEAHATGRDKLRFPLAEVVDLIDSGGRRYDSSEYQVSGGMLQWLNGGPGFDPRSQKGVIFAIRYRYKPYWYVQRVMHQVRVAQTETLLERKVQRMPSSFLLQREYAFESADNDDMGEKDPEDPNSALRQVKAPRDGMFGPR